MVGWMQVGVDWMELAIAWGLTVTLALVVAAIMRRPLYAILQSICGTEVGARFWTAYTGVMMVVAPLCLVSLGSFGSPNLADFVRRTMVLISVGLIATVAAMGLAVRGSVKELWRAGKLPAPPVQPAPAASASPAE